MVQNKMIVFLQVLNIGVKLYTPYLPPPLLTPATSLSSADPRTSATSDMRMLRLYSRADLEACPLDKWGILDPGETRRDTGEKREDGE
jgi:5-formyltetrahydrofolate cyclo-ligase